MNKKVVQLTFLFFCSWMALLPASLFSKDIISDLMKENVATFVDAAKLMVHSFQLNKGKVKNHDQFNKNTLPQNLSQMSPIQIEVYLKTHGIFLDVVNRPISRAEVAKTLIERYQLKKSWLTSFFGWSKFYFSDAQSLGIFSIVDQSDELLSTKSLLQAFMKAQSLSK